MRLYLDVQDAARTRAVPDKPHIRRWARAALAGVRRRQVGLTVRIVGEREGAALNRRYRGRRGATNVLSFPFEEPPGLRTGQLGDLVVCAPVVAREARTVGKPAPAHWAHMVVHGVLHLRGYDHKTAQEARRMERLERRILAQLGFADPYAPTTRAK